MGILRVRKTRPERPGPMDGAPSHAIDIRDRYPGFEPPNGWHVSRLRHPEGWIRQLVEDIERNGGSAHVDGDSAYFDDGRADVLVIETLYDDWGAFHEPWRIALTESCLEQHLCSLLKPDGTVHGLRDPDDPVETDAMMAAYNLFTQHLEEEASPGDALDSFEYVLIPGAGLHPREALRG